ncbi:MAG: xanthine dehydrogenase family protein subunit M [Spirochaetota bacterium]
MNYLIPRSLDEALQHISSRAGTKLLAGGTDLSVLIADGLVSPASLVDITGIPELTGIERTDRGLRIGAAARIEEVAASSLVPQGLVQGARAIGSPQIRNLGTIGGNICNASPCGDTLTPLLVLGGILVLVSLSGVREIPAEDFFTGPKKTIIKENEILKEIIIEGTCLKGGSSFRMIGKRNGQAISQVNAACRLALKEDGAEIDVIRIAVGSVAPVPLRLEKTEAYLTGRKVKEIGQPRFEKEVFKILNAEIKPITDVRASEEYRRLVTFALVKDVLEEALEYRQGA